MGKACLFFLTTRFFEQTAIDIEKHGTDFEHEHLQDNQEGFDGNLDIQIYNEALL